MYEKEFICQLEKLLECINGKVSIMIQGAITYQCNEQLIHPAASLIKLPILSCAIEKIREGTLHPFELISVLSLEKAGGSGVVDSLHTPTVTMQDLITLMITVSDNTATNWLINKLEMNHIQTHIDSMQLYGTKLQRYMMQTLKEQGRDNFTTAEDIVFLLKHYENEKQFYNPLQNQQFTYKLCGRLEGMKGVATANKTGELQTVTHDAARLIVNNKTVYIALLSSDVESTNHTNYIFSEIGYLIVQYLLK
ncbi:serine hydrolase [Bacillus cereus]|uniref:Class A beta-lactamase n=1 Tax=Bacillus cereus TaxID=1396 RepID=A0AA44QA11_BACCE|nr:serine hydrolase [Bacillus cereus]PFN07729.1 class A beta-lactamase [Bacillus cereus]PFR99966.1 class A beta-lactamase [Bacillus cereus]